MRVTITGGSGYLGRHVTARLRSRGHDVLVGTRNPRRPDHVRFALGSDVEAGLLDGVDTVIHLATDPLDTATEVEGAARLLKAGEEAGVGHFLYVSIVGIDDHPFPYYRAKATVERQISDSAIPHTIFRTTQFHGLIPRFTDEVIRRLGAVPIPGGVRCQPVDADLVAERVADLVEAGPSGRVPDLGGPEVLDLDTMVRSYLKATGRRVLRLRAPFWGEIVAAFRRGDHLAPHAVGGGRTYAQYLAGLPRRDPDPVGVWLRVVGGMLLATMVWMLAAPAGFHSQLAGFGELNTHFIRDTGTFILPLAVALWLAAGLRTWRIPVLVLALLQNGFHAINHLVDVANSDPDWHGPVNLAALLGLELVLWWLYRRERRRGVVM